MDDFDALLTPDLVPPEPPGQRSAIERSAGRVLRRRRWLGRARWGAALAACYAAGLATMWLLSSPPRTEVVERTPAPPSPEMPAAAEVAEVDPFRGDPPERLERWAFLQSGTKRTELYRRAGDGYLERADIEAALRCYGKVLDGAPASDLAIRADTDSWLLMSLKMSRQKEATNASGD